MELENTLAPPMEEFEVPLPAEASAQGQPQEPPTMEEPTQALDSDFAAVQPDLPPEGQLNAVLEQARWQLGQLQQLQGSTQLADQLWQINQLDPTLRSLQDLSSQPEFPLFDRLVRSGETDLVGAFKLAFFDRVTRRQAAGAHQAAINALRSKQHLAPLGGGEAGEDELTDEIVQQYRDFNPKWTRAQIRTFHRKFKKGE